MASDNDFPRWEAKGVEPPDELKANGFTAGYKPPASYFNWFWNRVSAALAELGSKMSAHADHENPHNITTEKIGAAEKVHAHTYNGGGVRTGGTSEAYTVTLEGAGAISKGFSFIMIPHVTSTVVNPTLSVNGTLELPIRRALSGSMNSTVPGSSADWLKEGVPIRVTRGGELMWIADMPKPNVADIYGTLPVSKGGTGRNSVTAGSYLVGDGTGQLKEKTPAEVLEDIGAAKAAQANAYTSGITTAGTNEDYTVTIEGITELKPGMSITIIPHVDSDKEALVLTLNVNGLGAKAIARSLSNGSEAPSEPFFRTTALYKGSPKRLTFNGEMWYDDNPKATYDDISGILPVSKGGTGLDLTQKGCYLVGNENGGYDYISGVQVAYSIGALTEILVEDYHYGNALPDPGKPGRIFFLKKKKEEGEQTDG